MLTVTGTAEFVFDNGRTFLRARVAIQPHVPHEHDTLVEIAETYLGLTSMDHGQLILHVSLTVPPRDLVADLEQTPSSAPSVATSVSDDSE